MMRAVGGRSGSASADHAPGSAGGLQHLVRASQRLRGERPFTVVMYHSISHDAHDFAITPDAFRRQIAVLRDAYPVARLRDAHEILAGAQAGPRLVITFDDAYRDFIEHAYPILEEFAVPCTLFVATGYIGGWNEWDSRSGRLPKARIMDAGQLCEVAASDLVDLGSHTVDHLSMRRLPVAEMWRQAVGSREALEALLERPVSTFSYPYGGLDDYSGVTGSVLGDAGYRIAVTTRWGSCNSPRNLLALRRISFRETDSDIDLRVKVEGGYDWLAIRERAGYLRRRFSRTLTLGDRT